MKELELKYGCNPNQKPAKIAVNDGRDLPIEVLCGRPGYILNGWAKKENLKNYVVYETTRNGQPWYVLVSGVYASKEEAKKAVSTLPADVQAKNPWAKPLRQVQADLK